MKYRNNQAIDFLMLIITVLAIWAAVFIKDSAQARAKDADISGSVAISKK